MDIDTIRRLCNNFLNHGVCFTDSVVFVIAVSCRKLKVLTGAFGILYTSGPHYENYETCSWRIQVPANKVELRNIFFTYVIYAAFHGFSRLSL